MPLKTLVKVGKITNLSDARYCSGMGVDMLGFQVVEGTPGYIAPSVFQEIRGWISGPQIVAEIAGLGNMTMLSSILESYRPDLLEVTMAELPHATKETTLPLIVHLSNEHVAELDAWKDRIAFVQIDEINTANVEALSRNFQVIAHVKSPEKLEELLSLPLRGISLHGSEETRPGFKEYTGLADILEVLDAD